MAGGADHGRAPEAEEPACFLSHDGVVQAALATGANDLFQRWAEMAKELVVGEFEHVLSHLPAGDRSSPLAGIAATDCQGKLERATDRRAIGLLDEKAYRAASGGGESRQKHAQRRYREVPRP